MSAPANQTPDQPAPEKDGVEAIVHLMPVVLPIVGGVLMFLMIFIAMAMA